MASNYLSNKRSAAGFNFVAAAIAFAYAPILFFHTRSVLQRTYYQFVPILVVTCGWMVWQQFKYPSQYVRAPKLEVALLAIAFLLLLPAVFLFSPWIGAASAIFAVGSLLVYLGGRNRLMELTPIWCLLWLILPPPFGFDIQLVAKLQAFTSIRASEILDYIGINHFMAGNILEFADKRLLVEEACSGVQSLFALFAYTAIYVVWRQVPIFRALLLIASSAFWAGAMNVVRVLTIAVASNRFATDLSSGWRHEVLGLAVFVFALLAIASTDQWLKFCLRFLQNTNFAQAMARRSRLVSRLVHWLQPDPNSVPTPDDNSIWKSRIALVAFFLIGTSQIGMLGYAATVSQTKPELAAGPDALSLPANLGDWTQTNFETEQRSASSIFGQHSKIWSYDAPLGEVIVSFDYSFGSWHDLRVCYGGAGWTVVSTSRESMKLDDQSTAEYLKVQMERADGRVGFLAFAEFENNGQPVNPVTATSDSTLPILSYMKNGIRDRWTKSLVKYGAPVRIFQTQLLLTSDVSPTDYEKKQLIEQFESIVRLTHTETTGASKTEAGQ